MEQKRGRGRPPGQPKTGGRKPGARNKTTLEREAFARSAVHEAMAGGEMPLEVILNTMRGAKEYTATQYQAAVDAAPYCHPKLAAVDLNATISHDPDELSDAELAAIAATGGGGVAATEDDTPVTH